MQVSNFDVLIFKHFIKLARGVFLGLLWTLSNENDVS